MKRLPKGFNWAQAHAFLATAEAGSFSAAARDLGLTQPTLGRQVAALEADLGVTLFERAGRSLVLTKSGLELLDHVRAMGEAAERVALTAAGQSQAVEGHVSLAVTDVTAAYLLPPVLHRLRDEAPGITVEIVASNTMSDLRRREADIALRHVRPDQPDLIARRVRDTTAHLYAAKAYLDRCGRPASTADLAGHDFVGFDASDRLLVALNGFGIPVTRENFRIGSEDGLVAWEMTRQGFGVGVMIRELAAMTPGVEQILPEIAFPVPTWLVTHCELNTSRRIRIVFDALADAFG
ncbi:LysR family transcriptional regulator [Limibaculum sp. M0105]|uniref:LysR family transcriptional regulator n=1 Tax=Thermohalobaculum xanthum TaxID=2753746 RepID=A0A8J7M4S1_9RHOB|nr:LysR family transcriptional regulator [Thermohalobaculum xanthum]MBK0398426.1 LysR family transcriptional regulator [Thermohalobaculum xanthum]